MDPTLPSYSQPSSPPVPLTRRWTAWLLAIVAGICGGVALFTVLYLWRGDADDAVVIDVQQTASPDQMQVWIGGAVAAPGLIAIERGSRLAEAVELVGGLAADADTSAINMARPLNDAEHIEIPRRAPTPLPGAQPAAATTSAPVSTPDAAAVAVSTPNNVSGQPAQPTVAGANASGLINVNTADAATLETLPEIGETLALRIIEYRTQHGPFARVDDLEAVNGISTRIVDILRPLVTVGP